MPKLLRKISYSNIKEFLPSFISTALFLVLVMFILNSLGLVSEKLFFWKNTLSKATQVVNTLNQATPYDLTDVQIYYALHPKDLTIQTIEKRKLIKKVLLGKTIDINLRITNIEKYGNRYLVLSEDENPRGQAEMLGADLGRQMGELFGKKTKQGHTISFCSRTNIYVTQKYERQFLDNLKEGAIVNIRGVVSGFNSSEERGIMSTLLSISNMLSSEKDDISNCLEINEAILVGETYGNKSFLGSFQDGLQDGAESAAEDKKRAEQLARLRSAAGKEGTSSNSTTHSYADKLRNKILPLIIFNPSLVEGNPPVEVGVELAPDGTIITRKILKSSGDVQWDRAVLRAIDDANTFPKDDGGKVPKQIRLTFKPKGG